MTQVRVLKWAGAVLAVLALTACKQNLTLLDQQKQPVGNIVLETDVSGPSPAHASLRGKEFSGEWDVKRIYDEATARKYRLMGSESYERYLTGSTSDQTYQGHATMKAQDATLMECEFKYRGSLKDGTCIVDGEVYTFIIEGGNHAG